MNLTEGNSNLPQIIEFKIKVTIFTISLDKIDCLLFDNFSWSDYFEFKIKVTMFTTFFLENIDCLLSTICIVR